MSSFTPRIFARWVGAWALALVSGTVVGLAVGFGLGALWLDENDDGWTALGDALAAGFVGLLVGLLCVLVVVAVATNLWVSPGRGWWGAWAVVWSSVVAGVLVGVILEVGGDSGPADVIAGWMIPVIVLVAHLDALRLIERRLAGFAVASAVAVVAVAAVVS